MPWRWINARIMLGLGLTSWGGVGFPIRWVCPGIKFQIPWICSVTKSQSHYFALWCNFNHITLLSDKIAITLLYSVIKFQISWVGPGIKFQPHDSAQWPFMAWAECEQWKIVLYLMFSSRCLSMSRLNFHSAEFGKLIISFFFNLETVMWWDKFMNWVYLRLCIG